MPTRLSQFCKNFDSSFRPVLTAFDAVAEVVAASPRRAPLVELRAELDELRHQVEALADKVAGQQAYVVIFGPLKSGKSTLMNAVAGAWVSEVSSLPAYPCLVFTSHGDRPRYVVTCYDGSSETFEDGEALRARIERGHRELAERMRAKEERGDEFDPQTDFPEAIRRIDVQTPAPALRSTSAVLVDTPGLYTRMRLRYDRMTRDFRDAAACAVFVVKSDNLFLEQVFAEFHRLLDLFSRVFLVVNIDTSKRDVDQHGKLVPSLEKRDPERILEAFENLTMTSPLRHAAEEGRLRIYPVDLLHAASAVLRGDTAARMPADFERFHRDLTSYLGSTEYLEAFLGDSLSRARRLLAEAGELVQRPAVQELRTELERTRDLRDEAGAALAALASCREFDWTAAFARFESGLEEEVRRLVRDRSARLSRALDVALDTWFLTSHGLSWLVDEEWAQLVSDFSERVHDAARRCLEHSLVQPDAGLDLPADLARELARLGIDAHSIRTATPIPRHPPEPAPSEVRPEHVPLRRGVLDLLALRSIDRLRERLFGPPDRPDRKIPARTKAQRLGEPARRWMREAMNAWCKRAVGEIVDAVLEGFGRELSTATVTALQARLDDLEPELRRRHDELQARLGELESTLGPFSELAEKARETDRRIEALAAQYSRADPRTLLQPVERRDRPRGRRPARR